MFRKTSKEVDADAGEGENTEEESAISEEDLRS